MRSRMLSSFPFLLAGMLALSSVVVMGASVTYCNQLDPDKDHMSQMVGCKTDTFDFMDKPNKTKGFKLSGLDQDTADKIFYPIDTNGKPIRERPKQFNCDVLIENSTVKILVLAFLSGRKHKVTIRKNKLIDFRIFLYPTEIISMELEVRGNKQLSMVSIYKLGKVPGVDLAASKIQHFQECFFDSKPLGSLAELEGCSGVEGDLVIDSSTNTANIPSTLRIAEIRDGCLRIEKSKLSNLKFLEGLLDSRPPKTCSDQSQNRYIKENSQLCLTSEEQIRWENYKLTYTGTCDDRCSADFASTNPTKPCQIVTGDVKITGNVDPTKLEHWDRVTVLEGTLEVDNTGLTEIEIFKKLKEIKNPSKFKRALTVTRNSKMEKFNLPKLKSITQQPDAWQGPVLFHQNNPAFKLSWPEYEKWQNITREDSPQIPSVARPIKPTTPSPPGSTTLSQEQIRAKNKSIQEANEQTYRRGKLAMWISGVVIVLFIIGLIAVIIYCNWGRLCRCFHRCSKKRKAQQDGHDADHDIKKPKKPAAKKGGAVRRRAPSKDKPNTEKEELTAALNADDYELPDDKDSLLTTFLKSYDDLEYALACQMARDAVEMPFKMSDMITKVNAEELDFKRVPPPSPEEKIWPKCYRFEHNSSQWLAFNPEFINIQEPQEMNDFDPHAVLKILLTNFNEFFVTNYSLITEATNYLSGPYYGGKSKNLLGKIDGPVTVATDIHSMLDILQVIFNIDFDEKNDNKPKVHPAFRQKYVFLGDYVDRGDLGLECSVLLCLLARLFPGNFVILRGNHDQRIPIVEHCWNEKIENTINRWGIALEKPITNSYHFADCTYWAYVEKVVAYMPYACLINGKVFACHAGLSLTMLQMKGTLDELFGKVEAPYYEEFYSNTDGFDRYYGNDDGEKEEEIKEKIKVEEKKPMNKREKIVLPNTRERVKEHFKIEDKNPDDDFPAILNGRKYEHNQFYYGKFKDEDKTKDKTKAKIVENKTQPKILEDKTKDKPKPADTGTSKNAEGRDGENEMKTAVEKKEKERVDGGYHEYKEKKKKKAEEEKKKKEADKEKKKEKAVDKEKKEENAADKEKKEEKAVDFVRKPEYEPVHPWLFELVWSEPGPSLTLYGNTRGGGNTYSYDNVAEFCEKFGLDYIVRGHTMRFSVSPDGKLVNIYSNPYHMVHQKANMADSRVIAAEPMSQANFASILRINPDGTRMFIFIRLDWEKERDQALTGATWKIRRELGARKGKKMEHIRFKEYEKLRAKKKLAKGEEQGETKKADEGKAAENKTSQQSPEASKSAPEKKSDTDKSTRKKKSDAGTSTRKKKSATSQSTPEKKSSQSTPEKKQDADTSTRKKKSATSQSTPEKKSDADKSTRKKKSKKSEAEKITDKSPASGQEGKSPMRRQASNNKK